MVKNSVILVAIDGSPTSMDMVSYLSEILSPNHVSVELFHIMARAPEPFYDLGVTDEAADYEAEISHWSRKNRSEIDECMETAKKKFMSSGFPEEAVCITIQNQQIGIARDIINKARLGCSALAVGRRGFGTLPDYMMGGVAAKLVETITHVPIAVVGNRPDARKILVAFDRSRDIQKGLEQVSDHFIRSIEEILLCHIVRPLAVPARPIQTFFTQNHEIQWLDENSRKIIPAMVKAKQRLKEIGYDTENFRTEIIKEKTSRADALAKEAAAMNFGTIIIGRRGASAVEEFSMGRVTRKVLSLCLESAVWIV